MKLQDCLLRQWKTWALINQCCQFKWC
jgi:hypothetical protein